MIPLPVPVYALVGSLILAAGVTAGSLGTNYTNGFKLAACAKDIKSDSYRRCPSQISDAIQVRNAAAIVAVQPIVSKGQVERQKIITRTIHDIQIIYKEPQTAVCGPSPAMQRLRQQLCDEVGGSDCDPKDVQPGNVRLPQGPWSLGKISDRQRDSSQ